MNAATVPFVPVALVLALILVSVLAFLLRLRPSPPPTADRPSRPRRQGVFGGPARPGVDFP